MQNTDWEALQEGLLSSLLNGETEGALSLTRETLSLGTEPVEFFTLCITPVLEEIGNRFQRLEIYLPEMVEAAEIVEMVNAQVIQPAIDSAQEGKSPSQSPSTKGKVLLATVQGDLHDIGKSMVALMLKVNGYHVSDMGIDVAPSDIVAQAKENDVDIIGLSSLLTTCLPYMKDVIDLLDGVGSRERYSVMVGGAAVTPEFARQIGADAYGSTAAEAVVICDRIMKHRMPIS